MSKHTPVADCLYYLEQEVYTPQLTADNNRHRYFDRVLAYVQAHGHRGLGPPELRALVAAAQRRNRLDELDDAVIQGHKEANKCTPA